MNLTLQGWLHGDAAAALFAAAGHNLEELRVRARGPDFEAFELDGVTFAADLSIMVEHFTSSKMHVRGNRQRRGGYSKPSQNIPHRDQVWPMMPSSAVSKWLGLRQATATRSPQPPTAGVVWLPTV
jgi:hypothetical protein